MRRILVSITCGLLLFAAAAPAFADWPHDPTATGLSVTSRGSYYQLSCSDGAGGMYVAFSDGANYDVVVQHVLADGTTPWGQAGVIVGAHALYGAESLVPDGNGGCIVSWSTTQYTNGADVYVQRLNASGTPLWGANGVVVCNAANNQVGSRVCADAYFGGAYVVWQDDRAGVGASDLYYQVVSSGGMAQLTANGVIVCNGASTQNNLAIVYDNYFYAYVGWMDWRGAHPSPYVQRVARNGSVSWTTNGVALNTASADAYGLTMIPGAHNDAFLAWHEWRSGNSDVFAQRINGSAPILWTANGVPVTTNTFDQTDAALVSDGSGGVIVAWRDARNSSVDLYAQRLTAAGTAAWTTNGVAACTAAGDQQKPAAVTDGSGGAVISWLDLRSLTDNEVYAQHVSSAGGMVWTADGVAIHTLGTGVGEQTTVSDGAGGVLTAWTRSGFDYVSKVDRFGVLGGAAPAITAIDDVPNDQGGYVSIRWNKSWLDNSPGGQISYYYVWRQVPQVMAQAALRAGAKLAGANEEPRVGALRATEYAATTYYWEFLGSVTAMGQAGYSVVEPTRGDSIAGSNPSTLFMIEARYNLISGAYWDSGPFGGYSVDNVAPATPAPFTGAYENGLVALQWGASTASDFAEYRLYRGGTSSFVPGPSTYVGSLLDPSYADSPGVPRWYKVVAVDVHGNVSAPATLLPTGTLGVDDTPAYALAFAPPSPNPACGRATFAFTLPAAGPVRLALFDAAGRCVRVIADGEQGAGEHRIEVELRDAAGGALPAGLFLARLEAAGERRVRRLAVVR